MSSATAAQAHSHRDRGLVLIAVFKLVKALLLLLSGAGLFALVRADAAVRVRAWLGELTVAPGQALVERALHAMSVATPKQLGTLGVIFILYGCLFATEGVGLWLQRRWAEYLSVIATASLIPFEIYELRRRFTGLRAITLVVNIAAVAYLLYHLRRSPRSHGQGEKRTPAR